MSNMDRLEQTLKALRDTDGAQQAPEYVETRIRAAFREHHAARRAPFAARWWWAGAFAASLVVAVAAWRLGSPDGVQAPQTAPPAQVTASAPPPPVEIPKAAAPKPRRERPVVAARNTRPVTRPTPAPREIEFAALPYAPPLLPEDQGQVIRVRVPRQSLRTLGFPVNEDRILDRVPADILMGQDGIARGIRLVRASEIQ